MSWADDRAIAKALGWDRSTVLSQAASAPTTEEGEERKRRGSGYPVEPCDSKDSGFLPSEMEVLQWRDLAYVLKGSPRLLDCK